MPSPTTVLYRRDLLGRIVAAGDSADPAAFAAWSYNADGSVASEMLKAGGGTAVTRRFAYDGLGRPVGLVEPAATLDVSYRRGGAFDAGAPYANDAISAEKVSYAAGAFPAGAKPADSTTSYVYDAFDRLVGASSDRDALDVAAAYDADGNLTSLAQAGTSRTYAYHDGGNRLASIGGRTYGHDAAGQVVAAGADEAGLDMALVRDPASGRVQRARKGAKVVSILRGADGRAALATTGSGPDETKRLLLRDGAGTPLTEHERAGTGAATLATAQFHGARGPMAVLVGAALLPVSTDLRDSIRFLYGADGKVVAWLAYLAYGALDTAASSPNALAAALRWRYTGQEWHDALGLYDYGARMYDPAIARFLSPDPEDETPSPYMYAGGDPVNAIDPDGAGIVSVTKWNNKGINWSVFRNEKGSVVFVTKTEKARGIAKEIRSAWKAWSRAKPGLDPTRNPYSFRGRAINRDDVNGLLGYANSTFEEKLRVIRGDKGLFDEFWTAISKARSRQERKARKETKRLMDMKSNQPPRAERSRQTTATKPSRSTLTRSRSAGNLGLYSAFSEKPIAKNYRIIHQSDLLLRTPRRGNKFVRGTRTLFVEVPISEFGPVNRAKDDMPREFDWTGVDPQFRHAL